MNRIEGFRLVAGFVFASAIGVLLLMLALATNSVVAPVRNESFELLAAFGIVAASVAYSAAFIIALPLFALFYWQRWLRLWQIATGGLVVGVLIALLPNAHIEFGLMFCAVGLTTGIAFWLIAVFRNRALTPGFKGDAMTTARV